MTNEELVYLYQNGDKRALEELTELNKDVIYKIANKFKTKDTSSIDREDLEQEGYTGLIIAANKYDLNNPSRASFVTYATYWVYQKISRYIKQKSTNDETSLNVHMREDIEVDIIETLKYEALGYENNPFPDPQEQLLKKQLRKELEAVMSEKLNLKERNVLMLHYGWKGNIGMPLTEIADMLGVTRSAAANIEDRSFNKIRRSPWGIIKGKEIREKRLIKNYEGYIGIEEKLTFLQRYFPEVMV